MEESASSSLSSLFSDGNDGSPKGPKIPESKFPALNTQEPMVLLPLTSASHRPTTTLKLEYTANLPEYPETDPHGFTYVVYLGGQDPAYVKQLMHDIQYNKKTLSPAKSIYCHYLDTKVTKYRFKCTGFKRCDLFSEDLKTIRHTSFTGDLYKYVKRSQYAADLCQAKPNSGDAYRFSQSIRLQFQNGYACTNVRQNCRPWIPQPGISELGQSEPAIQCVNSVGDPSGHYWKSVREIPNFDLKTAREIFGKDAVPYQHTCDMAYSTGTRLIGCKMPHSLTSQRLQEQDCNVVFQVMIPHDLKASPYLLFISHGVHEHMPPIPAHAPQHLTERTIQLVAKAKAFENKLPIFLKPPAIEGYCGEQYSNLNISQIRERLTMGSPLEAAIERQQLFQYLGTHYYLTTLLELDRDESIKNYIQEVHKDKEGIMIICALKEQLDMLLSVKWFEVHVRESSLRHDTLYEVVFAVHEEVDGFVQVPMTVPLVRVFTDQKDSQNFRRLFERVFKLARLLTGNDKSISFHHIHRSGYRHVYIDMERQLFTGFGQYLSSIDPNHREPEWQLQNLILFCKYHFLSKIDDLIGFRGQEVGLWDQLAGLIEYKTKQQFEETSNLLITSANEKVATWAHDLKDPVIAAGLNLHFSSIPCELYTASRRKGNTAEQTHNRGHVTHIRTLLPTITWLWTDDKAIMERHRACLASKRPSAPEPRFPMCLTNVLRVTAPSPAIPPSPVVLRPTDPPARLTAEVSSKKRKYSHVGLSSTSIEIDNGPINRTHLDDTPPMRSISRHTPASSTARSDALVRNWLESTPISADENLRREEERSHLMSMQLNLFKMKNDILEHEVAMRRLKLTLREEEDAFKRAHEDSVYWAGRDLKSGDLLPVVK